ncbi:MAG: diguanylate cyclase [Gammaproteobacteria bacterium]|nr:diguanylate cyclase [Gammaproteobacteria bacterium]
MKRPLGRHPFMVHEPTHQWDPPENPSLGRRLLNALSSLKCKATGLVVVLTLAASATAAGYLLQSSGKLARDQHDTQILYIASALAREASHPLGQADQPALQALAAESANGSPLLYVIFTDIDGRRLAVAEHGNASVLDRLDIDAARGDAIPSRPQSYGGGNKVPVVLDVTYPITSRGQEDVDSFDGDARPAIKLLGYVRTGMMTDEWHQTMSTTIDYIIGIGILATMAAIPLGFLLVRRIVLPLDQLGQVMLRLSQGELDARSPNRRRDEIGRLEAAFNRMADQHQHTHDRIIRLNIELERRVAQRTQQLRELASREPLTGLYNRRYLSETLERRFSEAQRYNADLSCIMIDLDGFKSVNDEHGHHVGDELLQLAANTISSQLRTADVAARFGGDEFVALLPQTDGDSARVLAVRIVEKFSQEVADRLPDIQVTMSVGISSLATMEEKDAEALIRTADHALYSAKASGRNRITMAGDMSKPTAI